MSVPSEPEKYSVDEMLERLKNRQAADPLEQGELVTREDGTQAIRVRKRKRRSHQPHKEELRNSRRARMIQVSVFLILLLLVVFIAGLGIIFANSAPYRKKVLDMLAQTSGATVELEQFRVNPTSANASRVSLSWPAGNVLERIEMHNVRASLAPASFFGRSFHGEEINAAQATFVLRPPQAGEPLRSNPPAAAGPVHFKRYAVPNGTILIGDAKSPWIRVQNSEVSFYPATANARAQLQVSRGEVSIRNWPRLKVDRAHAELRHDEVDLLSLRLRHENDTGGVFELEGTIRPYAAPRVSSLTAKLKDFPLAGVAGHGLGRLLAGRIDSSENPEVNQWTFTPGPEPESSLVVVFENSIASMIEMNGFPFQLILAKTLGDNWYEKPVFEDAGGEIRRVGGNIALSNLLCTSRSRMGLRGHLALAANGALEGELEVGLTDAVVRSDKTRALDTMFGPVRDDGFRWSKLNVTGTAVAPADNFKALLEGAASRRQTPPAPSAPSFEDLTRPR